jgi:DNA-binding transcriptional ArsR family regulator
VHTPRDLNTGDICTDLQVYTEAMSATRAAHHPHPAATSPEAHVSVMADVFGLLADPTKLRLLLELRAYEEVCVSDLALSVGISESAVSHALRLLRAHGVIEPRREGRWVYYSLVDAHVSFMLDAMIEHLDRDHR